MNKEDWFHPTKNPHIGLPIKSSDFAWIEAYVSDPQNIQSHSFLPLIHKRITERRFRADPSQTERSKSGKRLRIKSLKQRDVYMVNHLDGLVYSYYTAKLMADYEAYLTDKAFNQSIVAYRKMPKIGAKGNQCNIDFAKTAFEFIQNNKHQNLSVIVADVTSFFDNLNHKILKKQWAKVIKQNHLPADHYNLYKALTRIKYVERNQLFNSYDKTMWVERGVPNDSTKTRYKRLAIKDSHYFKEKNAVAYCKKDEFLKNNLNLIISKNNKTGIPQGIAISAVLANIYMLDFDELIHQQITQLGGFYQRYSDDLILICPQAHEDTILKTLRASIADPNMADLEIQAKKTNLYRFEQVDGLYKGFEVDESTKQANPHKTLNYLGFTYDGQRVLIKSAGLSKFYRSMKRGIRRANYHAHAHLKWQYTQPDEYHPEPPADPNEAPKTPVRQFMERQKRKIPKKYELFKSRLYKRFTYKGAQRKMIYRPSKANPKVYEPTKVFDWGNYLSYVYKANAVMKSLNTAEPNAIKKQSGRAWRIFWKLMNPISSKYTMSDFEKELRTAILAKIHAQQQNQASV
jgi:Reverse transcriptase (RNA-dependent DNA polymerase)